MRTLPYRVRSMIKMYIVYRETQAVRRSEKCNHTATLNWKSPNWHPAACVSDRFATLASCTLLTIISKHLISFRYSNFRNDPNVLWLLQTCRWAPPWELLFKRCWLYYTHRKTDGCRVSVCALSWCMWWACLWSLGFGGQAEWPVSITPVTPPHRF